jgi:beta-lactamase regulating signal transducer with metallopeptidase domain
LTLNSRDRNDCARFCLLPAGFMENHSRNEIEAAITHECAHIQRDDFRKNLFYEIAGLFTLFLPLTCFNPFTHR